MLPLKNRVHSRRCEEARLALRNVFSQSVLKTNSVNLCHTGQYRTRHICDLIAQFCRVTTSPHATAQVATATNRTTNMASCDSDDNITASTGLDAFEMKGLRKILWVSWTAKKTNKWVLNKARVKRELLDTVKARKL